MDMVSAGKRFEVVGVYTEAIVAPVVDVISIRDAVNQ